MHIDMHTDTYICMHSCLIVFVSRGDPPLGAAIPLGKKKKNTVCTNLTGPPLKFTSLSLIKSQESILSQQSFSITLLTSAIAFSDSRKTPSQLHSTNSLQFISRIDLHLQSAKLWLFFIQS